jgi:predicted  nucleic acid-binding Zn-ribbon protein
MELALTIIGFVITILIGIIGYFLRVTIEDLKNTKRDIMDEIKIIKKDVADNNTCAGKIKNELDVLKNDYSNKVYIINEKIDGLRKDVVELTKEIKAMNNRIK